MTGADLYALCSEALLEAVRQLVQYSPESDQAEGEAENLVVSSEHFQVALSKLTPSVTTAELERYQKIQNTKVSA